MSRKERRAQKAQVAALARAGKWGAWTREREAVKLARAGMVGRNPHTGERELMRSLMNMEKAYRNNLYAVQIHEAVDHGEPWGEVLRMSVNRHDGKSGIGWDDLMRVKCDLIGEERVAVEVFPALSELAYVSNMRHLWVLADGFTLPFTLRP